MAVMEFLKKNIFDTTTMAIITSGTATVEYAFDRNIELGYSTSGYNSTTSAVLSIELDETTTISHILLQNHNLKQFIVFYNSATANSLGSFTTNSATSTYLSFASISVKTIQVQMDNTIDGSEEKSIGELVISERKIAFPYNPAIDFFNPKIDRTQVKHIMPDGGTILFNIKNKYKATIGLRHITSSFYNSLLDIYDDADPIYFVPFPTSTSWDGKAYQCVWPGDFDFKFGNNAKTTYSGNITLEETISG